MKILFIGAIALALIGGIFLTCQGITYAFREKRAYFSMIQSRAEQSHPSPYLRYGW